MRHCEGARAFDFSTPVLAEREQPFAGLQRKPPDQLHSHDAVPLVMLFFFLHA